MKFYKIRHKNSGWFFKPSTHESPLNISIKGKVYQQKPSQKVLNSLRILLGYREFGQSKYKTYDEIRCKFNKSDWELVEYKTTETVIDW